MLHQNSDNFSLCCYLSRYSRLRWKRLNNRIVCKVYSTFFFKFRSICLLNMHKLSAKWKARIYPPFLFNETFIVRNCLKHVCKSYVYWTVHHLNSWVKRDQLDVTCFIISLFNAQHVSDVNTPIVSSLRLICWVISWVVLIWFDVCWCYVVVWLWWCGIRMQVEALVPQPAYGYHTTTAKPQRNTNTHRTRAIQPMK